MNIRNLLTDHFQQAMLQLGVPAEFAPHITPSKSPQFGDYQANGAMAAAKYLKGNPRELAQKIVDQLDLQGLADKVEIAGPGFINIYLSPQWLAQQLERAAADPRLAIATKTVPQAVVVDYSSPNLAKEMHVGHIRTTVIGDALARVLEFCGDRALRQNHVGDWGTQFGMLIAELELHLSDGEQADLALKDLETFYQQAKKHFDEDAAFADTARDYVVKLQSGDARVLALWEKFRSVSLAHAEEIYRVLNVTLEPAHVRGESAYNDMLPGVVEHLKAQQLVVENEGAQVVFLQELADKDGNPSPVIVQKKDGGYLYATTDLAAMQYRCATLKADRIMYFIDDRQSLHMKQVFTLAKKAKLVDAHVSLEHIANGKILGKDKKPFKTRSGETVKLADLLSEAIERAAEVVREKNQLSEKEIRHIAEKVGIGAIKYAELSKTRTMDYVFDWENMLSFEGNTGPYMQYAYTRICSVFRKANIDLASHCGTVVLGDTHEKALALKILQLSEILDQVAVDALPHLLCTYLYDLASLFMSFYEACPILKDEVDAATRTSRLQLSKATAKALRLGLDLMGIEVLEKM